MITHKDIHHIGLVTVDLQKGMEEIGKVYGVTWATQRDLAIAVRDVGGDSRVPLSVVYSQQGPLFLELIQAVPRTVWAASPNVNLHHIGIYVEDIRSEIHRLEGLEMAVEAIGIGPDGRESGWAYLQGPTAVRVELLDVAGREKTTRWARGEIA